MTDYLTELTAHLAGAGPAGRQAPASKGKFQQPEGQLTVDVHQDDENIVIQSAIAGVTSENIDISITNDMVTIRGRRFRPKADSSQYYHQELYWGPFSRSVILPVQVDPDSAKASIKNGLLTVVLPKLEKLRTKRIKISE